MGQQGEADRALEEAVPQHAHACPYGQDGHPCGWLQPPGADRRRLLAPAAAACHGRVLLLRGPAHLRLRPGLRAARRRQPPPAMVRLRVGAPRRVHEQAIPRLPQRGGPRGGPAPTGPAPAAGGGDAARAARVRAPGAWGAASLARPLPLIRGPGGCRVRQPGHRRRCLRVPTGRGLGGLGRPWAGMPPHKPACRRDEASSAGLALALPEHAWPLPAARRFVLRPPRLFHEERPRALLLAPGCPCLPHRPGPWPSRAYMALALAAPAPRAATRGLASSDA